MRLFDLFYAMMAAGALVTFIAYALFAAGIRYDFQPHVAFLCAFGGAIFGQMWVELLRRAIKNDEATNGNH